MNVHAVIDAPAGRLGFTADEFACMVDRGAFENMKVELVGGELTRMAPAGNEHAERHFWLASAVAEAIRGADLRAGIDRMVRLDDATVRCPDIAVYAAASVAAGPLPAADLLLVVEVADATLHKDLTAKAAAYAAAGVPACWIVEAASGVVHVMTEPSADGYAAVSRVERGAELDVPGAFRAVRL